MRKKTEAKDLCASVFFVCWVDNIKKWSTTLYYNLDFLKGLMKFNERICVLWKSFKILHHYFRQYFSQICAFSLFILAITNGPIHTQNCLFLLPLDLSIQWFEHWVFCPCSINAHNSLLDWWAEDQRSMFYALIYQ